MKRKKIAIVVSEFNRSVTGNLLKCCQQTFNRHGVPSSQIDVQWVPGAYEIPFAARQLVKTGKYAGVIALGCVIKGETSHDFHVANWSATGLGLVSLLTGVPCFFGVLTPNNERQAKARSRPGPLNRGEEVAMAALKTLGWIN